MKSSTAILALALLAGCGGLEEGVNPLATTTAEPDAGTTPPPPPPTPEPRKRTVMTRNPFAGPAGNLLADGDFELSTESQGGGQVGFRAFSGNGAGVRTTKTETGGLCRSGLRCAVFEPDTLFLLRGAAAKDKGNVASVWARVPAEASCDVVNPMLITCDTFAVNKKLTADEAPGPDGWCQYSALIPERTSALCLYLQNSLEKGEVALVDSAVLAPDDGTVSAKSASMWVPSEEVVARLDAMRETLRKTTIVGRPEQRAPLLTP